MNTQPTKTEAVEKPAYILKLEARQEAMKNHHLYLEECKRRYGYGGSESQGS